MPVDGQFAPGRDETIRRFQRKQRPCPGRDRRSPQTFEFTGCEFAPDGDYGCFFYRGGDGIDMRVAGGLVIGFNVLAVDFVAD